MVSDRTTEADSTGRLPAHTEQLFDAIDAGFFSGATFYNEDALARFEWYVARWQREVVSIRQVLKEFGND